MLGFAIGYAHHRRARRRRGVTAFALAIGASAGVGSYFGGDKLVLAVEPGAEVDDTAAPQLMNVVREMALAANVPMPKVYIIDDTAPTPSRPGATRSTRRSRSRPACSRSSIARSSRA